MQPHDELDTQDSPGPDSGPATLATDVTRVDEAPPLSAIEAAGVAGVNERTIRRAISGGQLPATKHRGAFRISPADLAAWQAEYEAGVPPDRSADTGPAAAAIGQSGESGGSSDGAMVAELWKALEDEGRATIAAKDETISRLDAEVAFLREQLDQRSRELAAERERFDVIQQLALQRIEALTSVSGDQRESAPERAPEPPGATEGGREGDPSSWWATMLRKVRGG